MRVTSLLLSVFIIAGSRMVPAATAPDQEVFNVIRQIDPTLVSDKIFYRNVVAPDLDLVIAIGSTAAGAAGSDSTDLWWDENRKLGLFLQEKARPDRVYLLTLTAGPPDCGARIERATSTDTVISCTGEKSRQWMNQKFVYDVRAKALVSHFAYQPFAMMRVLNDSGRTVFVGIDGARLVAVEFRPGESPEFGILTEREAAPWLARVGTSRGTEGMEQRQVLYLVPENPAPIRFGGADAFTFTQAYMERSIHRLLWTAIAKSIRCLSPHTMISPRRALAVWRTDTDARAQLSKNTSVRCSSKATNSGSARLFTTEKETPELVASATLMRPIVSITCSLYQRWPISPFRPSM